MKLVFARRAVRDIERCGRWWVQHRDARALFEIELLEALGRIRRDPMMGPVYRVADGHDHRRVLLPKTAHHVYYRVDGDVVLVLTVWSARRGRPPVL